MNDLANSVAFFDIGNTLASVRVSPSLDRINESRPVLFVGEDASERAQAPVADFLVAPHPLLAKHKLSGSGPLRYLRIHIPPAQAETELMP
jgi:hypothetical protein